MRYLFFSLLLIAVSFFTAGCVHNVAWRTSNGPLAVPDDGGRDIHKILDKFNDATTTHEVVTGAYDLFICEFDDAGISHAPDQIDEALRQLGSHLKSGPALILTFAHGWKNNGKPDNPNLQLFRWSLLDVARREETIARGENRTPRRVFGFYIGWRGEVTKVEPFRELSVWNRKAAGERVGRIGAPELITQISQLYTARRKAEIQSEEKAFSVAPTRSIAIGHSFGTIVIGESYLPWLTAYLADRDMMRPADLVLFINPAYEALRIKPLIELAARRNEPSDTPPPALFATLTSCGDRATRDFFPLSRCLLPLSRSYREGESQMDRCTIGHYEPYRTDKLHLASSSPEGVVSAKAPASGELLTRATFYTPWAPGSTNDLVYLEPYGPSRNPLIRNVYVDTSIIKGHSLPRPTDDGGSDGSFEGLIAAIQILVQNADMPKTKEDRDLRKRLLAEPFKPTEPFGPHAMSQPLTFGEPLVRGFEPLVKGFE